MFKLDDLLEIMLKALLTALISLMIAIAKKMTRLVQARKGKASK